jgi:hypothetical protein
LTFTPYPFSSGAIEIANRASRAEQRNNRVPMKIRIGSVERASQALKLCGKIPCFMATGGLSKERNCTVMRVSDFAIEQRFCLPIGCARVTGRTP